MAKLHIKLTRSPIGRPETQRKTLRALGLRKLQQVVEREDTPSLQGQIAKVQHLVTVTPVE